MKPVILCIMLASLLLAALSARATKPCSPSPCLDSAGRLDVSKCLDAASWVAVGKIIRVQHHPEGPPLAKDFATFILSINRWEKGEFKNIHEIQFKVGWCDNAQELPNDTSGLFRLYGIGVPGSESTPAAYLYIERVASK
jgi:hypothetical protein